MEFPPTNTQPSSGGVAQVISPQESKLTKKLSCIQVVTSFVLEIFKGHWIEYVITTNSLPHKKKKQHITHLNGKNQGFVRYLLNWLSHHLGSKHYWHCSRNMCCSLCSSSPFYKAVDATSE